MNRRFRNRVSFRKRPLLHGLVLVGLLPKFLVPLGYMPSAIADGGPLVLCESFAALPGQAEDAHTHHHSTAAHGHGATDTDEAPAPDQDAGHGQWERCSLGGLATVAAITADWNAPLIDSTHELVATATRATYSRNQRQPFQARAPPLV